MNPFSERYQSLPNYELLRIIQNESEYQVTAIEAAKEELASRAMSAQEISEAQQILESEGQEQLRKAESRKIAGLRLRNRVQSNIAKFNPFDRSVLSTERTIRAITILFSILAIYKLLRYGSFALFLLQQDLAKWDLGSVLYYVEFLLPPIAVVQFWFRKKAGWILMNVFMTLHAMVLTSMIRYTIWMDSASFTMIEVLISPASTEALILTFLFFVICIWIINRKDLRNQYGGSRDLSLATVGLTAIISFFLITL